MTFERLKSLETFEPGRINARVVQTALQMATISLPDLTSAAPPWPSLTPLIEAIEASDLSRTTSYEKWQIAILSAAYELGVGHPDRSEIHLREAATSPGRSRGDGGPAGWLFLRGWTQSGLFELAHQPAFQVTRLDAGVFDNLASRGRPYLVLGLAPGDLARLTPRLPVSGAVGRWHQFDTALVLELVSRVSPDRHLACLRVQLHGLTYGQASLLHAFVTDAPVAELGPSRDSIFLSDGTSEPIKMPLSDGFLGIRADTLGDLLRMADDTTD